MADPTPPTVPTPASVANMDPNFEDRYNDLRNSANSEAQQRRLGNQVKWDRPSGWSGDLFDFSAMTAPFSRLNANNDCVKAISDPANPGTTGDVVATTTMIECLASMERAFRNRHTMRRPRAILHAMSRKKGHGAGNGAMALNSVWYVNQILKQSRGTP